MNEPPATLHTAESGAATLGHESARITLDTYARTTDATRRRAAEIMQEALR